MQDKTKTIKRQWQRGCTKAAGNRPAAEATRAENEAPQQRAPAGACCRLSGKGRRRGEREKGENKMAKINIPELDPSQEPARTGRNINSPTYTFTIDPGTGSVQTEESPAKAYAERVSTESGNPLRSGIGAIGAAVSGISSAIRDRDLLQEAARSPQGTNSPQFREAVTNAKSRMDNTRQNLYEIYDEAEERRKAAVDELHDRLNHLFARKQSASSAVTSGSVLTYTPANTTIFGNKVDANDYGVYSAPVTEAWQQEALDEINGLLQSGKAERAQKLASAYKKGQNGWKREKYAESVGGSNPYKPLTDALAAGDITTFSQKKNEMLAAGYQRTEIEDAAAEQIKKLFSYGELSSADAERYMQYYGGFTSQDARSNVVWWDFQNNHASYKVDADSDRNGYLKQDELGTYLLGLIDDRELTEDQAASIFDFAKPSASKTDFAKWYEKYQKKAG